MSKELAESYIKEANEEQYRERRFALVVALIQACEIDTPLRMWEFADRILAAEPPVPEVKP